jgi:hypothetical protein
MDAACHPGREKLTTKTILEAIDALHQQLDDFRETTGVEAMIVAKGAGPTLSPASLMSLREFLSPTYVLLEMDPADGDFMGGVIRELDANKRRACELAKKVLS